MFYGILVFSSPELSSRRAIALLSASALVALSVSKMLQFYINFFKISQFLNPKINLNYI